MDQEQQEQVAQFELTIDQAREFVALGEALTRLHDNADFKKVVREGYFKDEAVRLVMAKANPGLADPQNQAELVKDIDAIGSFYQYLAKVERQAEMAESAIEESNEQIAQIYAENQEGGE